MLLLDAYNVLHCSHVLPDRYAMVDPAGLCEMIRHSNMARGGALVVCDGAPKPHEHPDTNHDTGPHAVRLRYAGPGRDADTLIEQIIARDDAPRQLVVVSNDRRIRRAARRRRAAVLHSETFLRRLAAQLHRQAHPPPLEKPTFTDTNHWLKKFDISSEDLADEQASPPRSDVRHWLRVFGYETHDDDDGNEPQPPPS